MVAFRRCLRVRSLRRLLSATTASPAPLFGSSPADKGNDHRKELFGGGTVAEGNGADVILPLSDEGGDGDFNNDITLPYFSGDEGGYSDDEDGSSALTAPLPFVEQRCFLGEKEYLQEVRCLNLNYGSSSTGRWRVCRFDAGGQHWESYFQP